jgi:putative FmdB family regulatory protein
MPTYDYVCKACDHKFEESQSIKANPLKKCPACGKLKLNRLIGTGSAVIFKGSGFYATDHKSASGSGPTKSARKQDKEESKPAEKSEKSEKSEKATKTEKAD